MTTMVTRLSRHSSSIFIATRSMAQSVTFVLLFLLVTPTIRTLNATPWTDVRGSDSLFLPFGAQVGDEIIEGEKKTKEMTLETPLTIFGREYGSIIVSSFFFVDVGLITVIFSLLLFFFVELFLNAPSHLYEKLCPSVRPSVRRSVEPSRVIFEGEKYAY